MITHNNLMHNHEGVVGLRLIADEYPLAPCSVSAEE